MTVEATAETMRSYLDALVARGDFADYFTDDVTWTIIGTDQQVQGREPVRDFLTWMHTQAFDAHPKVKTLVVGDGQYDQPVERHLHHISNDRAAICGRGGRCG